ncbi:MAG: VWA domain-containing protein [Candidatus Hydrogenedentes bacterium]|nr:VWA domain-containing protein [Candidatus Hydrogenedentota bacterium]
MLATKAMAEQVQLDVALGTPTMLAGQKQTTYLRVAMTGMDVKDMGRRAPVNVAFVIDKSGSMSGEKIQKAKEAMRMAIEKLRDDDIVSVVAYDSFVQVLVPATRLTDRNAVYAAFEGLTANNSTALFAGVSKGAAELRKFFDRERVNRIILLSDGLANVGPSSPAELGELGTSLGREGISVTTIGLGLDYNEDLMTKLALRSDGNHMFAERAEDLAQAFAREFGDVLTVAAQNVTLQINCSGGVRPVRVLGREADIVGQTVRTALNQLYGQQTKYLILEVEVPAGTLGSEMTVASVDVSYQNMAAGAPETLQRTVAASFTDSPAIVEANTKKDVMAAAAYQVGVERNILATRLRDEGKIEEARQVLISNTRFLDENAKKFDDTALQSYGYSNRAAAENLDDTKWVKQRKLMRMEQHEIITQQSK